MGEIKIGERIIKDMIKVRELVRKVSEETATKKEDIQVYRMFGSLTREQAQGMVIGITTCLSVLR